MTNATWLGLAIKVPGLMWNVCSHNISIDAANGYEKDAIDNPTATIPFLEQKRTTDQMAEIRAYEPYTLCGIPNGEPPSCEAPWQPTMYLVLNKLRKRFLILSVSCPFFGLFSSDNKDMSPLNERSK